MNNLNETNMKLTIQVSNGNKHIVKDKCRLFGIVDGEY